MNHIVHSASTIDKFGHSHHSKPSTQVIHQHTDVVQFSDGSIGLTLDYDGNFSASKRRLVNLADAKDPEDAVSFRFLDRNVRTAVNSAVQQVTAKELNEHFNLSNESSKAVENLRKEMQESMKNSVTTFEGVVKKEIGEAKSSIDVALKSLDRMKSEAKNQISLITNTISSVSESKALIHTSPIKVELSNVKKEYEAIKTSFEEKLKTSRNTIQNESAKSHVKIESDFKAADSKIQKSLSDLRADFDTFKTQSLANPQPTKIIVDENKTNYSEKISSLTSSLEDVKKTLNSMKQEFSTQIEAEKQRLQTQINDLPNKIQPSNLWKQKIEIEILDKAKSQFGDTSDLENSIKFSMGNKIDNEIENLRTTFMTAKTVFKQELEAKIDELRTTVDNSIGNIEGLKEGIKTAVIGTLTTDLVPLTAKVNDLEYDLKTFKNLNDLKPLSTQVTNLEIDLNKFKKAIDEKVETKTKNTRSYVDVKFNQLKG